MAAPDLRHFLEDAQSRMRHEKAENEGSWTPASVLVKEYLEQIETDQEILTLCTNNPVVLIRDLDLTQLTYRDQPSVLKIMRYAIGDYLFTRLREVEYELTVELKSSMSAV